MHRIDGNGHVANMFTEGVPNVTPATQVTDDWLNDVQEELADFIEAQGITLVKGTSQLEDALVAKLAAYTDLVDITGAAGVDALTVTADTVGTAIVATGGDSSGSAIEAFGGVTNGSAIQATGEGSGVALMAMHSGGVAKTVIDAQGWISLNSANEPAVGATVGANRITPMNICKAWVKFDLDGAGAVSNTIGFNVSGVTIVAVGGGATTGIRVTFVDGFDSTSFTAFGSVMLQSNLADVGQLNRSVNNAAYYEAGIWDLISSAQYNPSTAGYAASVTIHFFGAS